MVRPRLTKSANSSDSSRRTISPWRMTRERLSHQHFLQPRGRRLHRRHSRSALSARPSVAHRPRLSASCRKPGKRGSRPHVLRVSPSPSPAIVRRSIRACEPRDGPTPLSVRESSGCWRPRSWESVSRDGPLPRSLLGRCSSYDDRVCERRDPEAIASRTGRSD